MKITKTKNESSLRASIEGRVDTSTAPEFESEIKPELDGITELVLDFAELNYISSAGLRVLLSLHKIMIKQGLMKIIGVNETINDIFEVTGFSDILTIE